MIKITQNDNVYLLRNERPELGDLSIYVDQTRTRVAGRNEINTPQPNCDTHVNGDDTWSHVKVDWMYEKEKIAFRSSVMYVDRFVITNPVLLDALDMGIKRVADCI